AGLETVLDAVLSVEDVGVFKPSAQVYDMVGSHFSVARNEVVFVSSNGWDVCSAADYGFRTIWANRAGQPMDRLDAQPDVVVSDLTNVPDIAVGLLNDRHGSGSEIGETQYFTTADGLHLAYRVDGETGPALLCLCGLTRNMADFDYVARDFQSRAKVIRLDTRGRGQSDWDPDHLNYTVKTEARDALALLDHLGLDKAAILGTSRGGLIAMELAETARDRLTGVCFNDIGPEIELEGLGFIATYLGVRPGAKTYDEAADGFAANYAGKFPGVPKERWLTHAKRIYREGYDGLDLRYDAMLRQALFEPRQPVVIPDMWAQFDALSGLPVALIRGEHSDILSAATAEKMKEKRPDMLYAEIADRGHVPFLDEPDVTALIGQFLDQLP
ncbi:MAG: alpha/beta fold hydrolase, partial [Pseudomonadota bacterium]